MHFYLLSFLLHIHCPVDIWPQKKTSPPTKKNISCNYTTLPRLILISCNLPTLLQNFGFSLLGTKSLRHNHHQPKAYLTSSYYSRPQTSSRGKKK
ncbi:hypothetical protein ACJW30_09G097300 [Castanea mollissima]